MGVLDWEPSERLARWGKRVLLGVIGGGFCGIELLLVAVVVGTLTHTVHPGLQTEQDWATFLLYLAFWTPFTLVVTYALRREWPKGASIAATSSRKS